MQGNFDQSIFNMMLNMMNNYYPNMGNNSFNYNNNIYNNQILMNMMMNWINMNPNLLQMYNNMIQNNNNLNQNDNNMNQNNYMKVVNSDINQIKVNGGGLLLPKNLINKNYDLTNGINEPKTNVTFITQKGNKIVIAAPDNMKIKDLLVQYILRIGLGPSVIGDSIFFVFNGLRIDQNEEQTVKNFFWQGSGQIVVLDTKNIIGA